MVCTRRECNWAYNNIDKYLLENHKRGLFDTSLKGTSVRSMAYVIVHTRPQTSIKVKLHFVYEVCVTQPTTKRKWRYYHMYHITTMIGYMWYKYLNLGHLCEPKSIKVFFIFICMLLELEICNWKEKNELVIGGSVWYHESPIYSSDTKGPCPPFLSFFHWLRNEWHSHLTTHKATKNEVDHVKLCTRKWHKILHVKKWIMFGGHPEFVVRQPK